MGTSDPLCNTPRLAPSSTRTSPIDPWKEACTAASLLSPQALPQAASLHEGHPQCLVMSPSGEGDQGGIEDEAVDAWPPYIHEASRLLRLALPLSVTNLCGFALSLVTVSFIGRLGEYQLSVAILATSIFNVTGYSVIIGFAGAMETFCGQAFGAGNYRLVGVVLQRAIVLTTLLVLGVAGLWSQAEALLGFLAQDATISKGAARYLHLAIPALYFAGLIEVFKRYLLAQGLVHPATVVTLIALLLSPLYNWLLIFKLGWGLDGAALAVDAVQMTMASALGGYIVVRDFMRRDHALSTWGGWTLEALRGWGGYFRFALPSVVMICCEWWASEAVIIMSGWLPNPEVSVAVMGITLNLSGMFYMLVLGLAMATSTRVSNSLGAGCSRSARRAMLAALGLTICLQAACLSVVVLARHWLPYLFTNLPNVVALTAALLPIFALVLPGDGINAVLQGLLRGAGKQELGAVANICSYWLFGIPLAATCAFKFHLGLQGLWLGLVTVVTLQGAVMLTIGLRFNFEKQAHLAVSTFQQQCSSLTDPLLEEGQSGHRSQQDGTTHVD